MSGSSAASILKLAILVQAGLIVAIGLPVLGGWLFGLTFFLQLHPTLPPMSFNAAVWMTCCGFALASATSRRYQWAAKILGAVVLASAIGTLAEYAFNIDLGIDQLVPATPVDFPRYPGRPPVSTSVAFALAAVGLLLHGRPMSMVRGVMLGLCGAGASAIAAVSLSRSASRPVTASCGTSAIRRWRCARPRACC